MSYFISIKCRTVGSYTEVTIIGDLNHPTLMDTSELHLLKNELENVLEEVTALLPGEAE